MSSASLSIPAPEPPRPVASARHTIVFLLSLSVLTAAGAYWQHAASTGAAAPAKHPPVLPLYLSLAAGEWLMVAYVWRGIRSAGVPLRDLIGRSAGAGALLRDFALGAALWGGMHVAGPFLVRLFSDHAATVSGFLPQGPIERVAWVLVSVTAGFCEELVYRGYFQRQFAAWTGSAALGLLLQAALFAAGHAYQGIAACVRIAVFGLVFGAAALWRRTLRPGMIGHAATDVLAGLFRM